MSALLTAMLLPLCVLCGCQSGRGAGQSVGGVGLSEFRKHVEATARYEAESQKARPPRSGNQSSRQRLFEEKLGLETDGYVLHPNIFAFTLAGLFGLSQFDFDTSVGGIRNSDRDNDFNLEGSAEIELAREKKFPLSAYTTRFRRWEHRAFQSSVEQNVVDYGLVWRYVDPTIPTVLRFSRVDLEYIPRDNRQNEQDRESSSAVFDTRYIVNPNNEFHLQYRHDENSERPIAIDYDTDQVTLAHRLDFGSDHQHRLDSDLDYFERSNSLDWDQFRWSETLTLDHSDELRSQYELSFVDRRQGNTTGAPDLEEESWYLAGSVHHGYYDSITSQLHASGQQQDFKQSGDIDTYSIRGAVDYRKKTGWGRLLLHSGADLNRIEQSGGVQPTGVLDERQTFIDPSPVTLNGQNVVANTIVVTNLARTVVYLVGLDYTVQQFGPRTELTRVPTGGILNGQTVLVSYQLAPAGEYDLDLAAARARAAHEFSIGLTPFYEFLWQGENITSGSSSRIPEDIRAHTVGIEYWLGGLHLRTEIEDYDSTVNTYDAYQASASYSHHFESGGQATVNARWRDVSHDEPLKRDLTGAIVTGSYRQPLSKTLSAGGSAQYRKFRDSLQGDDEGLDLRTYMELRLRQTIARLTYELGRFTTGSTRSTNSIVFFEFRRDF